MSNYRLFAVAFKRQVSEEYLAGASLHARSRKHEVARNLIRIWVAKYQAGEFEPGLRADAAAFGARDQDRGTGADGRQADHGARVLKGGLEKLTAAARREYIRRDRPDGLSTGEDVSS